MRPVLTAFLAVAFAAFAAAYIKDDVRPAPYPSIPAGAETAILSMGCFWCAESAFEGKPGILSVTSGHTGGALPNPTYEQVGQGGTGHVEAILVVFDPKKVTYGQILDRFWRNIDPHSDNGQFCDRGDQYRSVIWTKDAAQKAAADASKAALAASGLLKQPIVTRIEAAQTFYPAERYHQDFAARNRAHYERYRRGCGRDDRLDQIWGKDARGGDPAH